MHRTMSMTSRVKAVNRQTKQTHKETIYIYIDHSHSITTLLARGDPLINFTTETLQTIGTSYGNRAKEPRLDRKDNFNVKLRVGLYLSLRGKRIKNKKNVVRNKVFVAVKYGSKQNTWPSLSKPCFVLYISLQSQESAYFFFLI